MEKAIKLAIEKGGYDQMWEGTHQNTIELMLDPLFWQALGRALGWSETHNRGKEVIGFDDREKLVDVWLYHALRCHELVLTGGDQEKFWKDLLIPQTNG
jgi:hypothetical protein